jgi:hypothetical protein
MNQEFVECAETRDFSVEALQTLATKVKGHRVRFHSNIMNRSRLTLVTRKGAYVVAVRRLYC